MSRKRLVNMIILKCYENFDNRWNYSTTQLYDNALHDIMKMCSKIYKDLVHQHIHLNGHLLLPIYDNEKINKIPIKGYKGSRSKMFQIFRHYLGAIAFEGH